MFLLSEVLIKHCLHIPLSHHPARSYSCPGRWTTCKTGCARAAIDGRDIRLDKAMPALHVTWSAGRVARATRQKATEPVSLWCLVCAQAARRDNRLNSIRARHSQDVPKLRFTSSAIWLVCSVLNDLFQSARTAFSIAFSPWAVELNPCASGGWDRTPRCGIPAGGLG